jgi:peptidyl-prolyl cis-trans isomerase SurA
MRHFGSVFFVLAFLALAGLTVPAQETEERVVDEVIAQVNEGVITLSKVKREAKGIVEDEIQRGKKREEAEKFVEEKRGEMIANLIHEELLIQKAKQLGLDKEIEASVLRRFSDIMKANNIKTLEALYQEMERTGTNPQEIREIWTKQATRDIVLQKEVQAKIYWGASGKELKDYFEKHKAKFTKPETVTVSEIFLGFAGRDENAVREKAQQLVTQLRAGGDFAKLAAENSDPGVVTQGRGSDKLRVSEMSQLLSAAVKDVKIGAFTDPIAADQLGVVILRIDAREKASSESYFDENAVRLAMTVERAPEEQKKFFASLRADSYIKISDSYRPIVSPILFSEDRKEKVADRKDKPANKK